MSDYIVKDTELTSVANAIRTKGGTNSQLVFPSGFVSAIGNISGGGGSSDFSTAEVTLINNYERTEIQLIIPTYFDDEEISTSINYIIAQPNETVTQNAFLYKNSCFAEIKGFEQLVDPEPLVTVSGNVVYEGDGFFTITGDCTITIS